MLWGQTSPGGRPIPLDPDQNERGNCEQIGRTLAGAPIVRVLTTAESSAADASLFPLPRYMPHAATCETSSATTRPEAAADAAAARNEALARVVRNAEPEALVAVEQIMREMPSGVLFTTDQVWFAMAERGIEPHERRVIGAVIRKLRRLGVIRPTGDYRPSVRPECHASPKPLYERA